MIELRQSTERIIPVGSAMAIGDGFTPVTTLALAAADQAEILKANGAATVDISGYTFAAITGADGWYHLTVTASGSDTLGEMKVVIQDASLSLPIEETFMVVTQQYWDSKYGTDNLQVDMVEVAGSAVAGVGDFKADVSNLDATVSSRAAPGDSMVASNMRGTDGASTHSAADVWLATTRTLTGVGTLIADIWGYATRSLTDKIGFAPTVSQIDAELTANHGPGSWLEGGAGGTINPLTITLEDQFAAPLIGAQVQFTDDVTGTTFLGNGVTDAAGQIVLQGQSPGNYRLVGFLAGYSVPATTLVVVAGASAQTVVAAKAVINAPANPDLSLLYGDLITIANAPAIGATVDIYPQDGVTPIFIDSNGVCTTHATATADANGHFEIEILQDVPIIVSVECLNMHEPTTLITPTQNIAAL